MDHEKLNRTGYREIRDVVALHTWSLKLTCLGLGLNSRALRNGLCWRLEVKFDVES